MINDKYVSTTTKLTFNRGSPFFKISSFCDANIISFLAQKELRSFQMKQTLIDLKIKKLNKCNNRSDSELVSFGILDLTMVHVAIPMLLSGK